MPQNWPWPPLCVSSVRLHVSGLAGRRVHRCRLVCRVPWERMRHPACPERVAPTHAAAVHAAARRRSRPSCLPACMWRRSFLAHVLTCTATLEHSLHTAQPPSTVPQPAPASCAPRARPSRPQNAAPTPGSPPRRLSSARRAWHAPNGGDRMLDELARAAAAAAAAPQERQAPASRKRPGAALQQPGPDRRAVAPVVGPGRGRRQERRRRRAALARQAAAPRWAPHPPTRPRARLLRLRRHERGGRLWLRAGRRRLVLRRRGAAAHGLGDGAGAGHSRGRHAVRPSGRLPPPARRHRPARGLGARAAERRARRAARQHAGLVRRR